MEGKKPYLVVLLVNSIYAAMYILSKAAFNEGMSTFVFIFYRQAIATVFLAPLAFAERKKAPPLSFVVLVKIFMLSLIGITFSLDLYGVALNYTSSTVASATSNSVPVITFFFAIILRMERLKLRSLSGVVKLLGVTLCLGGVMAIAFYQGPQLNVHLFHHSLQHRGRSSTTPGVAHTSSSQRTWVKGTFLMITANSAWSLWLVMQGSVLIEYPSKLLFTTLQCLFSMIQSFVVAAAFERDFSKWKLGLDVGLLAVVYCGLVVTGVSFYLQAWCIEKKGPVFLAMSTPLAFVITLAFSSLLLGEFASLGSVLGGLLMVGGLYSVLWGKSREQKEDVKLPVGEKDCGTGETSTETATASPFHPL